MSNEKGKVETVNLPPSAVGMLDGYLTIIRTEATASPIYKTAMNELRQMAEMADMFTFERTGHLPDEWL
jgi:O-acetylhomoserine/O-acetylserine sulfhydrylase-like pyridoxal-dependent enzyme